MMGHILVTEKMKANPSSRLFKELLQCSSSSSSIPISIPIPISTRGHALLPIPMFDVLTSR